MQPVIRILLAEDQQLIRSSLRQLLLTNERYEVVASVANGKEALYVLETGSTPPDLCILDVQMPEMDGIACTRIIKQRYPAVKIVLLTSFDQDTYLEQAVLAQADGYVLKDTSLDSFDRALAMVLDGQFVAPGRMMQAFSLRFSHLVEMERNRTYTDAGELLASLGYMLDEKETDIIRCIWQGWTNRMIAEDLYISEGTVKNYVSRIYRKLKIGTRTELLQLLGSRQE